MELLQREVFELEYPSKFHNPLLQNSPNHMKKIPFRNCPICEYKNVEVLHTQRFLLPQGNYLPKEYDVVYCENCSFAYADTPAMQIDYDRYYADFSKYEDNQTGTGGGESQQDAERLQKTAECIAEFIIDKNAHILDIGCANGGLLKYLQQLGYLCLFGLDPSPTCAENTAKLPGVKSFVGSLFTPPDIVPSDFDCIIVSHTLEHIYDLKLAVKQIDKLLKKGAYAYIEVPDASRYSEFIVTPFQDFNVEHINHFSRRSMTSLFGSIGWTPVQVGDKVFDSSPQCPYPAIYSFWQKESDFKDNINRYIVNSQIMMNHFEEKLQSIWKNCHQVIVWGTGQLALKLLAETSLSKAEIVAFVDGNPVNHGKVLNGVKIISPKELSIKKLKEPIIIASTIHQEAITKTIYEMGFDNQVILLGKEST